MTDWFWVVLAILTLAGIIAREKRNSYREGVWDAYKTPNNPNVKAAIKYWAVRAHEL